MVPTMARIWPWELRRYRDNLIVFIDGMSCHRGTERQFGRIQQFSGPIYAGTVGVEQLE